VETEVLGENLPQRALERNVTYPFSVAASPLLSSPLLSSPLTQAIPVIGRTNKAL
jgi:hypothetical protein